MSEPRAGARVPAARIRRANEQPVRPEGEYVLYWMIAARRLAWNFGLDRAVELALELGRPLLVFEPLRCGHRWASARSHRFLLDGMAENARRAAGAPITYRAYVEPSPDAGKGLLEALARRAAAVVTDEFPGFFLPRMVAAAARRLEVRLEAVDSNGLLPLSATDRAQPTAYAFRRVLQRELPRHLDAFPSPEPLEDLELPRLDPLPARIDARWPAPEPALLAGDAEALARLPVDAGVPPVPGLAGGASAAARRAEAFLGERLDRYAEERNQPDLEATSGLSAYLHFGHLSVHDLFARLAAREGWAAESLAARATGARAGWWGMSAAAEAFLDELVTWRELGHHFAWHRPADHDRYESLPEWSKATLAKHRLDPRPALYELDRLERAETHDPLWNAAQRQLRLEGRIHNYLRMLWGKKILEWSPDPQGALATLIELNNRWALDGRDPNSYSGIFWCLGRFDRPWGPERPVFGTVRYLSSTNTARKLRIAGYLERYGARAELLAGSTRGGESGIT